MSKDSLKIDGNTIPYKLFDNNVKTTLLAVHGIHSDYNFIGNMPNLVKNYNIMSISLEQMNRPFDLNEFTKIIDYIVHKTLKRTKVHLLVHSLAGIPGSQVAKSEKIEKVYYVDTIHPLISQTKVYKMNRKKVIKKAKKGSSSNKISYGINRIVKEIDNVMGSDYKDNLEVAKSWQALIDKTFDDVKMWENYLDKNYKATKDKAIFIVGKIDLVISTSLFVKYVESIDKKAIVINALHSPIKRNIKEFIKVLESHKGEKRSIFSRRII